MYYVHTFIAIHIQVVGCRENGDECWEASCMALSVHFVASILGLVSTDY